MGLDITVYRIKKLGENFDKENDDFFTLDEKSNFPEWTKKFVTKLEQEHYDWDKFKEQTGIDIDTLEWCYTDYGEDDIVSYYTDADGNDVVIKNSEIPTRKQMDDVIGIEEIGYQRKGLNSKFYEDYDNGKIGYFVWTKAELERYKQEYCDEKASYYNGEEYSPRDNFQRNIINNFEEGKDCVTFDW